MADDFFGASIDDADTPVIVPEPAKIKIGEEEFDLEQAQRLVSLGKIGLEAEEKYNTRLDRVWPEFTKTKNEMKELHNQMQVRAEPQADPNDEMEKAKAVLKNLGFMTKEEAQSLTQTQYRQYREAEKVLESTQALEAKYNGTDGRPKANAEDLLMYMQETGIRNPEVAYKIKYEDELDSWRSKQIKKKPGLTTETAVQADKQPSDVRPNPDNLLSMISEALGTRE